ncbi:MAG TPA: 4-hydroxybenzoate 3-monooxygenase, partial [Caulobacteraceae bacterium]|nr:4-hydroxybenzoate 3-monooxygenase [Caulobacteraceae bacterium]
MRAQVGIIGGGPAGLFLGLLLQQAGVEAVVLERHSRAHVEARVRAGMLEPGTVALMERLGLAGRMRREGLVHAGINLAADGEMFRIDFAALTGRTMTVYGQSEVMRDLYDAAAARGLALIFEADDVRAHDLATDRPHLTWMQNGAQHRLDCDAIAGCDGFHGVSRASIPPDALTTFERAWPFGWLGILADAPPADEELIYCSHERGFALATMRSPTRSRYYLQCPLDERLEDWPDERFWDELCLRLGPRAAAGVTRAPAFEKSIAPLRSFVAEPMRYGRLFLAGDAAHIVPPTGAKGLNLAASDVVFLAEALTQFFGDGSSAGLEHYSDRALARV